jgi:predicted permease
MAWTGELMRRIRMLLQRRRFQEELDEEMRLHVYLRQQERVNANVPVAFAHSAALRRFGNPTRIKEESYMSWGWHWLESFVEDVRYGTRSLWRSKGLTLVAVLSLGFGIGANTAIFSFMDAVMLRTLPVKEPSQLVLLGKGTWAGISDMFNPTELYSYPFYREMQKQNEVFSGLTATLSMMNDVHGTVDGRNDTELIHVQIVAGTYFSMLGVPAYLGRTLTDEDDNSEGDHPVAVVSYGWWRQRLASDPAVLGKKVKLGDTTFEIVGVAAPEFFGTKVGEAPNVWVPLSMMKSVPPHWQGYKDSSSSSLYVMGRLKPGVTMEQATGHVNLLYQRIQLGFEGTKLNRKQRVELEKTHVPLSSIATGLSNLRGALSDPLRILMVLVALVLLIACANVANLLLARSTARAREFAVRQALGARRMRLVRQLLTESLLLASGGGALGIGLAWGASRLLLRMISAGRTETVPLDVSLNPRMLLFTFGVTVFTALFFGTLPALRATGLELTEALKDGRGTASTTGTGMVSKILIVMQVAFSLVLLVGSGLFLRSLVGLTQVDPGFNKENVLRLQTDASSAGYKSDEPRLTALYQQIEDRVSALHGVVAASYSSFTFNEGSWNGSITVPGMPEVKDDNVKHNMVGHGYFKTMQIPLLEGRTFGPQDTATSQKVAVISESVARKRFPAGSPIGRHYHIGGADSQWEMEVIGVVKDVKFGALDEKPEQIDYVSYVQRADLLNDFEVRYTGDFGVVSTAVQQAIHSVDRTLPITRVTTLDEQVARSITQQKTVAQLSTCFGLLAVFLSSVGIYGLMSYAVSLRTNEIGIRMALGAARSNVRWLVMREIVLLVAFGVALGVPVTLAGGRLIANLLFGLKGADATSILTAVGVLLVVAVVAGFLPARRASSIDPMRALRYE